MASCQRVGSVHAAIGTAATIGGEETRHELLGVGQAGAVDFGRWYLEGVSIGVGGQTGDRQEVELRRGTGERQHCRERNGTRLAAFGLSGIGLPTPEVWSRLSSC